MTAKAHLRHGLYWDVPGYDIITLPDRGAYQVRRISDNQRVLVLDQHVRVNGMAAEIEVAFQVLDDKAPKA